MNSPNQNTKSTSSQDGNTSHYPEPFDLHDPPSFEGTRTVLPPRADRDGKFLVSELFDWYDFMSQVFYHNSLACHFFKHHLPAMAPQDAQRAAECIRQIESIKPIFTKLDLALIPQQQRLKDVTLVLEMELIVCVGCVEGIELLSHHIVGSAEQWPSFAQALVGNSLHRQRDWRHAKSPAKWVKKATNNLAKKEFWVSQFAVNPLDNQNTVSLEEIAELPAEAVCEPKYTQRSIAEFEAAVKEDPEVTEYVAAKVRFPSWRRDAIWRHLGWDDKRGDRVDRRYRRARTRIRELGGGIQCRDYCPPAGVSDANCTVYFEPLLDGAHGIKTGVWQHRDPDRLED